VYRLCKAVLDAWSCMQVLQLAALTGACIALLLAELMPPGSGYAVYVCAYGSGLALYVAGLIIFTGLSYPKGNNALAIDRLLGHYHCEWIPQVHTSPHPDPEAGSGNMCTTPRSSISIMSQTLSRCTMKYLSRFTTEYLVLQV
jgi:hypothetical protein